MSKARKSLNEDQVRTILAVFGSLKDMGYSKMNTFLGSITITEMEDLYKTLDDWYQPTVNNKIYDEELGWIDRNLDY